MTERVDFAEKLLIQPSEGVGCAWLVNPPLRTLVVLHLEQGQRTNIGTYRDGQDVCAEPFDAIARWLDVLWQSADL